MKNIIKTLITELKEMSTQHKTYEINFENIYMNITEEDRIEDKRIHELSDKMEAEHKENGCPYEEVSFSPISDYDIKHMEFNDDSMYELYLDSSLNLSTSFIKIFAQVKLLNNMLDEKEDLTELKKIEETILSDKAYQDKLLEFEIIQKKEVLTVRELEIRYGYKKTTQQNLRNRVKDNMPYNQTVLNGKITYNASEIEKWKENQWR